LYALLVVFVENIGVIVNLKPLTFGSLFAGIGGFDLGFERAGMVCRWQVEIDDYANRVLAKHWPNVHRERDIRETGPHNLERVDVICGGFPCQDISYAGEGAGLDGARSGLFFEAVRVVRELQPRVVVLENVAALLTRGLDRVLGTLAEVGYDAEWHSLSASSFGLPHLRARLFIIAYPSGERREGLVKNYSVSRTEKTPFAVNGHRSVGTWLQMVRDRGRVRSLDGLSVGLERSRLKGCGNAVVPQIAELIGRQIVESVG